jgi:hypothetical protein
LTNFAILLLVSVIIVLCAGLRYLKESLWYITSVPFWAGAFVMLVSVVPWSLLAIACRRRRSVRAVLPFAIALQVLTVALAGPSAFLYLLVFAFIPEILFGIVLSLAVWWLAQRWPRQIVVGSAVGLGIALGVIALLWIARLRVPGYIATNYVLHDKILYYLVAVTSFIGILAFIATRRRGLKAYGLAGLIIIVLPAWRLMPAYPTETVLRQWFSMRAEAFTRLDRLLQEDVIARDSAAPLHALLSPDSSLRKALAPEVQLPGDRAQAYRSVQKEFGTLANFSISNNLFYVILPSLSLGGGRWGYVYAFDPAYLKSAPPRIDDRRKVEFVPRFATLASPWFLYGVEDAVRLDGP